MSRRRMKGGDMKRWIADCVYSPKHPRHAELFEEGRQEDRRQEKRKRAQARRLRQKRGEG